MNSSTQALGQLESARSLALGDGRYYPTIIPGVLPIIGPNTNAALETRRWGADFLAETFASPTWPSDAKETCSLTVLPTLRAYLEGENDAGVVKSAVQAAATIYPLVYRHIISTPHDTSNWQLMTAIKSNILRRMDTAPPGVRICCVKFVQQVVLVETPGMVADPRRPEQNDISLALVPRDHPLMLHANLEAEASGLLDRLLDIVHGDHSDALLVTAALNSLGMLVQRRPYIANKILSSVLNFNPLKLANSPMTPKNKVMMKSMERTTRALLVNVIKRNPEGPFTGRIQQYLERIHRMRLDVFDESNRKRPAPVEPTDGLDPSKRQRVGASIPSSHPVPPLPPGPVSFRQLFTLDPNGATAQFDVQAFKDPEQLLRILVPVLQSIDEAKLGNAINIVRSRYLDLSKTQARTAAAESASLNDEEEEYEPDFEPEDAEQIVNKLDSAPPDGMLPDRVPSAPLAPYKLPQAPPLTEHEIQKYGDGTVRRVFGMLSSLDETSSRGKTTKGGFNRLAASSYDRDSWVTILSRLATRAAAGLDDPDEHIKSAFSGLRKGNFSLSESIRSALYNYIMYDWKKRIDVAISWLNEEWYNDRLQADIAKMNAKLAMNGNATNSPACKGNYQRCALRLVDGIIAFAEGTDKVLLRFMSEIPELDRDILQRMKKMAEDPERIDLAIMVLQYLYMFRPPAKEICIEVLEDMWHTNDRAKPSAKKLLSRWRPEVLETDMKMESANGALEVKAV
ncbi:uncharacterized protein BDR25DRAFT_234411 [Lindgomyces ingoldianus]|uniref:Uncharacterized protein n=1 Tax=Lindgomyces ingoldianus TaxID=673940 RepID=A0ACB6QKF8_9PLEO|nr:uncharacterized protein BDR25DRAFT_234411 [Lindgomyces ingoldianus]KAF2467504.1 hypothetical protein BDR25DRAFT_234411 [Lindgomyces ingoldianus]